MITLAQNQLLKSLPQTALMYHAFHDTDNDWLWSLDFNEFRSHLAMMKLSDLSVSSVFTDEGVRSKADILLTFDDGYANNSKALELVLKHGYTATLYVVYHSIGSHSDWQKNREALSLLSMKEIKRFASLGVEIGLHGAYHQDMTAIQPNDLQEQLVAAKSELENQIGKPVFGLAYPYGRYNKDVMARVRDAGFLYACSTEAGRVSASLSDYQIKRLTIENMDTLNRVQRKLILGSNNSSAKALLRYLIKSVFTPKVNPPSSQGNHL
ncbi:polysaccharide deacetylase family protein [Aestuariirhabdus sp. LZHN29]|uniref:polysaccharide deacetylase family protein n=1 Tax=Aestuariirhabdus sp. LZHN29 TaxID=3417462 RepID=UPI003CEDD9D3